MVDPTLLVPREAGPVHGDFVLTHLARAAVDLEDQATTEEPHTVSLRIGDEHAGVLLLGDLLTVQRLVIEADRQLARLQVHRRVPRR